MKFFDYCLFILYMGPIFAANETDKEHTLNVLKYYTEYHAGLNNGCFGQYHTLTIGDQFIHGQRQPLERLRDVPYDFTGKTVLDIGTNLGGMLFAIADKIRYGVGVDFQPRAINFANRLAMFDQRKNLSFYVFDLDKEPLEMLVNFLPEKKFDICFVLSICLWVKNWKKVVDTVANISDVLLFETHDARDTQAQQVAYIKKVYKKVIELYGNSNDDAGIKNRRLYLCSK